MAKSTKAYLAFIFISIAWGTTYLAIKVGVLHYPPFLFAGMRQVISGLVIMMIGLLMSRKTDMSWKNLKHNMLIGFLLITVGNGLVTWAERFVPSGVAALICGLMPIIAVMINLASSKKENINSIIALGMLLGFAGVGMIFRDNIADLGNTAYLAGILSLFAATSCWAWGSIINKKKASPINAIFNSGMQLLFGGVFLLIISPFSETYENVLVWNAEAFWSLIYLIIFGSILAYTAYIYALRELPVGFVTSYAYINPLVAVLCGYWVLNEQLTWFTALSFAFIVAGIFVVNQGYRRERKKAEINQFGNNAVSALPTPDPQKVNP